jgi:hypothetical protein
MAHYNLHIAGHNVAPHAERVYWTINPFTGEPSADVAENRREFAVDVGKEHGRVEPVEGCAVRPR